MAQKWEKWKKQKGLFRVIFRSIGGAPPQLNAEVMAEKLKIEPLVLLLEALDDALTYIEYRANSTPPPYNEHELQLVQQIKAAIAAAEGE